jgi:hypothetical protein
MNLSASDVALITIAVALVVAVLFGFNITE